MERSAEGYNYFLAFVIDTVPHKCFFSIFLKGKPSCTKEISEGIERSSDDKRGLAVDCHRESSEREDASSSEAVLPQKGKHNTGGTLCL